jgi:hypothetical protein
MGIFHVQGVTGTGNDCGVEGSRLGQELTRYSDEVWRGVCDDGRVGAVAAAEGQVEVLKELCQSGCRDDGAMHRDLELLLTTGDDERWALKDVGDTEAGAHRHQLSGRVGLAVLPGEVQHLGVKGTRGEEVLVDGGLGRGRNVAVLVLASQQRVLGDGAKVGAEDEAGDEVGDVAEAGEDDAGAQLGVQVGEVVGHGGAEGVADVDNLSEGVAAAVAQGAVGELLGEGAQGLDLEELLDLVDGVAVGGVADAEAVPGQRGVAVVVDGAGDVAVVVVVEGEIPVAAVEADAVGEQLDRVARPVVGLAVGRGELVVALDGGVLDNAQPVCTWEDTVLSVILTPSRTSSV